MINDKCESVSGGQEDIDPTERAPGSCKRLASHALVIAVCGGVVIGFGLGFALRQTHLSEDAMMWTGLPGEIFMRMLKVTILPVIVCSIIHGTATMDPRSHGRVSLLTLGFVFLANTVGSLTGILCYFIVRPSEGLVVEDVTQYTSVSTDIQPQDMFADLIRNIFPDNILTACFQKTQTRYDLISEFNSTNTRLSRSIGTAAGTNVLGVLFMSAVIGTASSTLGEKGKIVVDFFEAFSAIFIKMLTWFMWSTPVGVASLIAVSVARVVDIEDTFSSLGLLVVAFLTGIIFHQLVLYPVLLLTIFRMNPLYFYLKSAKAWMAVFGPPSSAIGIPEILRLCEEDFTVDKRVSRFVVPFGATESRIGSTHFIALSVLFLAGVQGVSLNPLQVFTIWILCSMSSLAVPAVPSASLVVVLIILTSVNVDSGAMGILFTLEWFTDRLRTTSNSMANIICTMTVDKLCKGKLEVVPTDKTQQPNVDSCDSDSDTDGTKSVLLKII
ncbi:putative sodium-dependent excitatory amino acid transporter glt-6 isoform X1 [Mizuhopecten yessoensis]|uniref:Amino acid transporter n=1 Tax=Mizuhopecten yessoensis TaxID=6573 RepID=A0A210QP84_MIZYE|nr:putative sodium-dependent excitatory amino acid transporter glt-6 isoform X1 [Mizuhopecten yessoensis]OWF50546.1 Excitatory amino acid transporter 2 [Mizuhopecten yessoensis]